MVNSSCLTHDSILEAIRKGNFYSSCGPELYLIKVHGKRVRIRTSPIRFVRLVGLRWRSKQMGSFSGRLLTKAFFDIPENWSYAYLEIEDFHGRRDWTNSLFVA